MRITTIKSIEIRDDASRQIIEIRPEIPFNEFPVGPREAGPDADGKLVWRVAVSD